MSQPFQIVFRLLLYVFLGVILGVLALEISFRIQGLGVPKDNRNLWVEWHPEAPIEWFKMNDFHVWLRPGSGRIEYRSDIEMSSFTLRHITSHLNELAAQKLL